MQNINNITILFCEGPHDTAFLYRILKTRCYEVYNDILDNLPKVIGKFIESKNKSEGYNRLKVDVLKNDFLPYRILFKENRLILMYSLGGDKDGATDETNKRLVILKHFFDDISSQIEIPDNYGQSFTSKTKEGNSFKYNFLFFYDADENKEEKLGITNTYLKKLNLDFILNHNNIHKTEDYSFGTYIFSDNQNKGALENILFDIMKTNNETIFKEATQFYDKNFDNSRTKRISTNCINSIPSDKRKGGYEVDQKKSIIAIAGQLQKKGKSNVVVIEDSDYLTLEKIKENVTLQEIANFIENSAI